MLVRIRCGIAGDAYGGAWGGFADGADAAGACGYCDDAGVYAPGDRPVEDGASDVSSAGEAERRRVVGVSGAVTELQVSPLQRKGAPPVERTVLSD